MAEIVNVRLILEKVRGRGKSKKYKVELQDKDGSIKKSQEFTFNPNNVVEEKKTFQNYFDDIDQFSAKSEDLKILGHSIYNLVFQGELKGTFEAWLEQFKGNPDLKMRLQLDIRTPELVAVPWELMYTQKMFLIRRGVSIVRFISSEGRKDVTLNQDFKVLIASAATAGPEDFDEDAYVNPVKSIFENYQIVPDWLKGQDTNYKNLRDKCETQQYDIFHLVAHGTYAQNVGNIVIFNPEGRPTTLESGDLGTFLKNSDVKLAFLCSCETAKTSSENPFLGVAQNLIVAGIPSVLAMQYKFPQTQDAIEFAEAFYRGMQRYKNIEEAMEYARTSIPSKELAWFIPVLYAQFNTSEVVFPQSQSVKPISPVSPIKATTITIAQENPFLEIGKPAPPDRFCGQVYPLNDLIDALLLRRNLLFVGERRIGKTSLLQYLTYKETIKAHGFNPTKRLHIFFDVSILTTTDLSFSSFWRQLLKQIKRKINDNDNNKGIRREFELLKAEKTLEIQSIQKLVETIRETYEIVCFLDEFDRLISRQSQNNAELFNFLATLNENYGIIFVVSALYRPEYYLRQGIAEVQQFFDSCIIQNLSPFNEQEYDEFLSRYSSSQNLPFKEDDCHLLYQLTGYYPYYLHVSCSILFDLRLQGEESEKLIQQELIDRFWQKCRDSFQDHWDNSDEQQKIMLILLALRGQGRGKTPCISSRTLVYYCPNAQDTLDALVTRGIVKEFNGRVALFCRSFEAWIINALLYQEDSVEDRKTTYETWYERQSYHKTINDDYGSELAQKILDTFCYIEMKHWIILTRWYWRSQYRNAVLSLLSLLPTEFSPQDYLMNCSTSFF